jgi:hypothetical protein
MGADVLDRICVAGGGADLFCDGATGRLRLASRMLQDAKIRGSGNGAQGGMHLLSVTVNFLKSAPASSIPAPESQA